MTTPRQMVMVPHIPRQTAFLPQRVLEATAHVHVFRLDMDSCACGNAGHDEGMHGLMVFPDLT